MREKILLVDDDRDFINFYTKLLEEHYDIQSSMNLKDTLSLLNESPYQYDLIISDIFMPEINGFELHDYLKEQDQIKYIPIIFKTSSLNSDVYTESMINKQTELLSTYMTNQEFLARIRRSLNASPILKIRVTDEIMIIIDTDSREIIHPQSNTSISFTTNELKTLQAFDTNTTYITKESIIEFVYGENYHMTDNNFNTVLSNIRKKIEPFGIGITNKRNIGLRIEGK